MLGFEQKSVKSFDLRPLKDPNVDEQLMAIKISRTAFKRLCILPLFLIIFIFFFYKQIANIYRDVDYTGNVTVVQRAFDLFKRQPTDVCHEVDLLNVGYPEVKELTDLSSYPQIICNDPGLR